MKEKMGKGEFLAALTDEMIAGELPVWAANYILDLVGATFKRMGEEETGDEKGELELRLYRVRKINREKRLLLFAAYRFKDETTQAVLEALNALSKYPLDITKILKKKISRSQEA